MSLSIENQRANLNSFTGFKVVLQGEKDGEFYSSFTGQKYDKNWLPKVTEHQNSAYCSSYWGPLNKSKLYFDTKMVGKTFVFKELDDAKRLLRSMGSYTNPLWKNGKVIRYELCGQLRLILQVRKVTIYGGIREASFSNKSGYVGRRIVIGEEVV